MKFTEEQKELLAFLPTELQNSKEITDSAKLVLGNIIFLYGMEEAQKNGYVYRTNQKMMEETGIKSEHTLIGAVRLLKILEYIKTKRGKRKEASTYELLINCSKTPQNCSNNCSEIETLQNQVLILQKQVVLLQKEIENLKNCSNNCSTDTETDKEIETDTKSVSISLTKDNSMIKESNTVPYEDYSNCDFSVFDELEKFTVTVTPTKEEKEISIYGENQQNCSNLEVAAASASLTQEKMNEMNAHKEEIVKTPINLNVRENSTLNSPKPLFPQPQPKVDWYQKWCEQYNNIFNKTSINDTPTEQFKTQVEKMDEMLTQLKEGRHIEEYNRQVRYLKEWWNQGHYSHTENCAIATSFYRKHQNQF